MMLPRHRIAALAVALAAVSAAAWLLLFALPDLLDRHSDAALAAAGAIVLAVPSGLAWGAIRLRFLFAPEDDDDAGHDADDR